MNSTRTRLLAACVALALLAAPLTGCRPAGENTPGWWPIGKTATPETPANLDDVAYAAARDSALTRMRQVEPIAPASNVSWQVEDATPEGALGTKVLRYTADDWSVTVTAPISAPQYLFRSLYRITVVNGPEQFSYECHVTNNGLVYEAPLATMDALLRVLTYLQQSYPDDAPSDALAWIEERATPDDIIGALSYRYLAGDWTALVSWAVTAPTETVYTVALSNPISTYAWRGEVHPDGSLVELPAQPVGVAVLSQLHVNEGLGYSLRYPTEWSLQAAEGGPLELTRDGHTLSIRIRGADAAPILLSRATPTGDIETSGIVTILGRDVPRSVIVQGSRVQAVMYSVEAQGLVVSVDLLPAANATQIPDEIQAQADAIAQSVALVQPAAAGPIEGWVGTVVHLPAGNQYTHYFQRQDGLRSGITSLDDALRAQLDDAAWTGASLMITGTLETGAMDYAGRQVAVTELTKLTEAASYARDLTPHATATASSHLPADRFGQYEGASAIDGAPDTAWTEAAEGPGIGESVTITFPGPITVTRVGVLPGWDHPDGYWSLNNRVQRATLRFSGGEAVTIDLADAARMQYLDVGPFRTTSVELVIEAVYAGSTYDDTCIGEVAIWGIVTP